MRRSSTSYMRFGEVSRRDALAVRRLARYVVHLGLKDLLATAVEKTSLLALDTKVVGH